MPSSLTILLTWKNWKKKNPNIGWQDGNPGKQQPWVVIYTAKDEPQAREIMENDPAVKSGVMLAEFHPFRLAFLNSKHPYILKA